jgi:secreted protein
LVGYQEMVPPSGGEVCTNVAGQQARKADAPALVQAVNNIDRAQREAAEQLKLGFIDLKTASAGHSSCSADPWVNGVGDARATMMGGVWHPSVHAEEITGDIIAQYVRQ